MTNALESLLEYLYLDEPLRHDRLTIIPLKFDRPSQIDYRTLDELGTEAVEIDETDAGGSVPEVKIHNRTAHTIFIPDGSTLVGCKQNRVINLSILLAANSETRVPVSCVEQGRWQRSSGKFGASEHSDGELRRLMCADTSRSLRETGEVSVNQGAVWKHVQSKLEQAQASSPTSAYHAVYSQWQDQIAEYEEKLCCSEDTAGAAVLIDEKIQSVDLFDRPATFKQLWPRLLRSYAIGSLSAPGIAGGQLEVQSFVEMCLRAPYETFEPVGAGTNLRLNCEGSVGAALLHDDDLVHLSLFASE